MIFGKCSEKDVNFSYNHITKLVSFKFDVIVSVFDKISHHAVENITNFTI